MKYVLHVAALSPNVCLDRAWLDALEDPFVRIFAKASSEQVQLELELHEPYYTGELPEASRSQLANALAFLTYNEYRDEWPIQHIALLFASRWKHQPKGAHVLGIMFDADLPYHPDVGTALSSGNQIHREGCAVFVDEMRDCEAAEHGSPRHIARTAAHELGHVFNLQHDMTRSSFMAQTTRELLPGAFSSFTPADCRWLENCPNSEYVQPGGSPFGFLGAGPDGKELPSPVDLARTRKSLQLKANLPRDHYLPGEPVILDVTLRPAPGVKRSYAVPHELDPGYERFGVWVQRPDGEVRRYRPLNHYCGAPSRVLVSDGSPLTNNVSVFWGVGGYTLDVPGVYKVWASLALGADLAEHAVSDPIEVEVARPRGRAAAELVRLLGHADVARAMFHRGAYWSKRAGWRLSRIVNAHGRSSHALFARYVLGRACVHKAQGAARRSRARSQLKRAEELLRGLPERKGLNVLSRQSAVNILKDIERMRASG